VSAPDVATPATVHEAVARRARERPNATALCQGGREVGYRELDAAANRVAHRLLALGVAPGDAVGVDMARSVDLVAAFLGIWKVGAFHVPFHEATPARRRDAIVAIAGIAVVVTDRPDIDHRPPGCTVLPNPAAPNVPDTDPALSAKPGSLAYAMFTSGSTGEPKGVCITHANVLDLCGDGSFASYGSERVAMLAPHAFDASVFELWVPLIHGGTCVLAPPGPVDLHAVAAFLTGAAVSVVHVTAGLFRVVADEAPHLFGSVREVLTGGDVVSAGAVRAVLRACPGVSVRAMYGPTETTVFAMAHRMTDATAVPDPVPLGVPLDGVGAQVLDNDLQPVPDGTPGELYLSGPGVGAGYLGDPALTEARFVTDPHGVTGTRCYRTGDIVRRRSGAFDFLGRDDDQVKINGFRVETGEIVGHLRGLDGVRDAAVTVRRGVGGERQLVGYVLAAPGAVDPAALRTQLAELLPGYMVPTAVVPVPAFPLTANGKLDVDAFPDPPEGAAHVAPTPGSPEELVCELYTELLGIGPVGTQTPFFSSGGTSLTATRLVSRLRACGWKSTTLRDVLEAPTPAELGRRMRARPSGDDAFGPVMVLRAEGDAPPLFCLPGATGLSWGYAGLVRHLPSNVPVYGLQAPGLTARGATGGSLTEMAREHANRIDGERPDGPVSLLGWSFGGLLAHAVAAILHEAGREVVLLVLLDARPGDPSTDPSGLTDRQVVRAAVDGVLPPDPDGGLGPGPLRDGLRERGSVLAEVDDAVLDAVIRVARASLTAHATATPPAVAADTVLVVADPPGGGGAGAVPRAWAAHLSGNVRVQPVPFAHHELLSPAALDVIGPLLAGHLPQDQR
jgi:amino acid adenylation domain-containing protein